MRARRDSFIGRQGYTKVYKGMQGYTRVYKDTQGYSRDKQGPLYNYKMHSIRRRTYRKVPKIKHTLKF